MGPSVGHWTLWKMHLSDVSGIQYIILFILDIHPEVYVAICIHYIILFILDIHPGYLLLNIFGIM